MKKRSIRIQEQQFIEVLNQIQTAKQQVYQQVNKTLVQLYWNIGQYISLQVKQANWGKGIIVDLALFIQQREPGVKGFGDKNLWRMKQFYEIYQQDKKLASLGRELSWTHNRRIMSLKTAEEREFYLLLCSQKKYSVRELDRLIKSGVFERTLLADQKISETIQQLPQNVDGIPLINPANIINGRIVPSSKMMIDNKTRERLSKYILKIGEFIVARRGDLSKCAIVSENESGWLCGTGSFFIQPSEFISKYFFLKVYSSFFFKNSWRILLLVKQWQISIKKY